ncbi:GDP-L-fucose synthase [Brevundimonas sp.]|uniref:GDP-L-fucose synthase n=1 Tax=Brevundimonas sp. TaxID=1871086 RepID=UPI002626F5C9|nr:GDP-L-fucose synthase [Brevundimonas sp.]
MTAEFSLFGRRVWVAGHRGMVGSAIMRRLALEDCTLITAGRETLDLSRQAEVDAWMEAERPDVIFLAAAKVGGILANDTRPGEFLYENLVLQTNIVEAARKTGVTKLMLLGSSCIYPKHAEQPISEDSLLTGPLEPTNEWYAIAKIAGLKLGQAYRRQYGMDIISAMPTNLYGPGDNFDLTSSHVLPALIRKAHEAKVSSAPTLTLWGTGTPMREFLHADDCADACVHLMKRYSGEGPINVGSGEDLSIRALAELVCEVVGYQGELVHDLSKPDGTPRKLMSADRLRTMNWRPSIPLSQGIGSTYAWFLENVERETVTKPS